MKKISQSIIILIVATNVFSQKLDNAAVHRIGDYCKLWAVINLFHPQMAYNTINEDSLFTENINELIKDPSAVNFKDAVKKMIDRLNDPYTTIEGINKNKGDSIQLANQAIIEMATG
ncbi:MAG: hypothetical protein WKG06_36120 [Segetibacter sp.]